MENASSIFLKSWKVVRKTHFPSLELSTQSNVKKFMHLGNLIYFSTKFSTFHAIKQSLNASEEPHVYPNARGLFSLKACEETQ